MTTERGEGPSPPPAGRRVPRVIQRGSVLSLVLLALSFVLVVWLFDLEAVGARAAIVIVMAAAVLAAFAWTAARSAEADAQQTERDVRAADVATRHRLGAVLDSVDEAIVLRDSEGFVRLMNRRACDLFQLDLDEQVGKSHVELLRSIARKTEDPEGFMELFQQALERPDAEIRGEVEQIVPLRRRLRMRSGPVRDDDGTLLGRIDMYSDVTEAVQRADEIERLLEQAQKTTESYQRALLPRSAPTLPRVSLVPYFVPASDRSVCGDFYDFVPFRDGRVGLVLGDVCGMGPEAANDAALTRYTLRSFATEVDDVGELFVRLNEHITRNTTGERFVRLLLVVLDPERAGIEYASAGHVPPAVYRTSSGTVDWLPEGGIVLGVDEHSGYKSAQIDLAAGDLLVLYSDGVTEASRHGRPFGRGKFMDVLHDYGRGTAGELVQAIRRAVEGWVPRGELHDDVVLVVGEVLPDEDIHEATRELVLPNEPVRMKEVRAFVSNFLADVRAPVEAALDVVLAVGEAAANASRHGRKDQGHNEIRIRCSLDDGGVTVTVADEGGGFEPRQVDPDRPPDKFASGGRGLYLMNELVDDLEIDSSAEGTMVSLHKRFGEDATGLLRRDD